MKPSLLGLLTLALKRCVVSDVLFGNWGVIRKPVEPDRALIRKPVEPGKNDKKTGGAWQRRALFWRLSVDSLLFSEVFYRRRRDAWGVAPPPEVLIVASAGAFGCRRVCWNCFSTGPLWPTSNSFKSGVQVKLLPVRRYSIPGTPGLVTCIRALWEPMDRAGGLETGNGSALVVASILGRFRASDPESAK